MKIKQIFGREILDSRGNPTVEAAVELDNGFVARASVPSGASTGSHEALELRDGDKKRYGGLGVLKAVKNINQKIDKELRGANVLKQRKIDDFLLALDGTSNKSNLGANAILGVSLACCRAAALSRGVPPYEYIREAYDLNLRGWKLPTPMMNIFNGGKHADTNLDFQEFMIIPHGPRSFVEKVRCGAEIFHKLGQVLRDKGLDTDVGNEGGYAPDIDSTVDAIKYILEAIRRAGYKSGREVSLGVDVGASELYDARKQEYVFQIDELFLTREQMIHLFHEWVEKYPFYLIEDPINEDDWVGWKKITKELGKKTVLVGDDLFVTNVDRLKKGIKEKAANAILIKLNQIGTLSETIDAVMLAKENKYKTIISHRSGETTDDFIADLAVAVNADMIKSGSLSRGERVCKYNRLMEIEEEI